MTAGRVSLGGALGTHRNAFGFLRWAFAVLVIVTHSVAIGGLDRRIDVVATWSRDRDSLGGLALGGFFVLSGLLVAQSWHRSATAGQYLGKRVLRIMPGFWVCLLVTALVFAPLAWQHEHGSLSGLFGAANPPTGYVLNNLLLDIRQSQIAGLLHSTPLGRTSLGGEWNGSLWTLLYESACYLGLLVLGLFGWRRRPWLILVVAALFGAALVGFAVHASAFTWTAGPFTGTWVVQFGFLFSVAAAVATYAERIPLDDRLGIAAGLLVFGSMRTSAWIIVGYPSLVYAVLWAAARLPIRGWDRRVDLSYGTYIYAFPLQMLLAEYGVQRHGAAVYILASIVLSTIAALLSWQLVERIALRWKGALPQRRTPVAV